jgi:hypothetical protein
MIVPVKLVGFFHIKRILPSLSNPRREHAINSMIGDGFPTIAETFTVCVIGGLVFVENIIAPV